MPDQGVNAQAFLRLLLGGAQKGADVLQQRQSQQQAQAPDLMMALQQMSQHQRERGQDVAFREQARQDELAQIRENRNRQFGLDTMNQFQQMRTNINENRRLTMEQQRTMAEVSSAQALVDERRTRVRQLKDEKAAYAQLAKDNPKLAPYFGALGAGANPSSLGPLLNSMGSLTGNETVDKMISKGFEDLYSRKDAQGNPVPTTAAEVTDMLNNAKSVAAQFQTQPDGVAEPVQQETAVLGKMQSILSGMSSGGNIKGMQRLSVDEALKAISMDAIFDPSSKQGNDLARERANDLASQGFIDRKTYVELLKNMGFDTTPRHPFDIGVGLPEITGGGQFAGDFLSGIGDALGGNQKNLDSTKKSLSGFWGGQ